MLSGMRRSPKSVMVAYVLDLSKLDKIMEAYALHFSSQDAPVDYKSRDALIAYLLEKYQNPEELYAELEHNDEDWHRLRNLAIEVLAYVFDAVAPRPLDFKYVIQTQDRLFLAIYEDLR